MRRAVCQRVIVAGMLMVASSTVPIPADAAPTKSAKTALVAFDSSPFPYSGQPPGQDKPFYDLEKDGRRGHTSPRGGVYWEDVTYSDRRVLLHIPRGFNPALPALMIVYLHGNMTNLEGVVHRQQQVPRQVSESGLNAMLVAPQFAVNALDSSAGRFYEAGHFRRFVEEAGKRLARLNGDGRASAAIESLPVILVAYSGGYAPAAWVVHHGGIGDRLRGVILLDALYAELDKFAAWIEKRHHSAFFFSAYSRSARDENAALQHLLAEHRIDFLSTLPQRLGPGRVVFVATPEEVLHGEFVNRAWVDDPLRDVLARIPGYPRTAPPKARKR
ncbi:MAG TPA: alpha/beta hydrolase [Hyphomicrobiaceae bacterium]